MHAVENGTPKKLHIVLAKNLLDNSRVELMTIFFLICIRRRHLVKL